MSAKPQMTPVKIVGEAEMPMLTDAERRAFIDSLREAEAQVARGEFTPFEPEVFQDWLRTTYDNLSKNGG